MGVKIYLMMNKSDFFGSEDFNKDEYRLGRRFCFLICRKDHINHLPELDQIGVITGVDISPIHEMDNYYDDEDYIQQVLDDLDAQEEKDERLHNIRKHNRKIEGNIDKVTQTINQLIEKLEEIDDLPRLLLPTNKDTLGIEKYFGNEKIDIRGSCNQNNFKLDLKAFQKFLSFAKENGADTVWFMYH